MHLSQLVSSNDPTGYSHGSIRPSTESLPRSSAESAVPLISIPKRKRGDDNPPTYSYPKTPQAPLSPPEEESSRCSLPSISSLFEGADSISQNPPAKRQRPNQPTDGDWNRMSMSHGERPALPPTPPLRPGSGFQGRHRSSTSSSISPHSAVSGSNFPGANPSPASEAPEQGRISAISVSQHSSNRSSLSQQSRAPIHETPYSSTSSTATQPPGAYASPVEPPATAVDYYRGASQPNSTYPPPLSMPIPPSQQQQQQPQQQHHQQSPMSAASVGSSAWQHHHYFHSSNTAAYPLNQDRYICRTCHKAFSRPSSLRIHSHSHTGEKPFRCPHAGCGKAFSVRSNMKRHERGCHSARATAPAPLVG